MTTYIISDTFRSARKLFDEAIPFLINQNGAIKGQIKRCSDRYEVEFENGDVLMALPKYRVTEI